MQFITIARIHVTGNRDGACARIDDQAAAVQAECHIAIERYRATIRRERTVPFHAAVAEVCTNRSLRRVSRPRHCTIRQLHVAAAAGREIAAIRIDIGIEDDGTNAVAIDIGIQYDIELARRRRDGLIDCDIALCLETKGRILLCCAALGDGRIYGDCRGFVLVDGLDGDIGAFAQQCIDRLTVNPGNLVGSGRLRFMILAIRIAICRFGGIRRFLLRDHNIKRVKQPFTGFARFARRINLNLIADFKVVARRFNPAAVGLAASQQCRPVLDMRLRADSLDGACTLPGLHAGCIERAVNGNDTSIAAIQQDFTLLILAQLLASIVPVLLTTVLITSPACFAVITT